MRIRNENTYMNHSDKMCYIRTTDDDDIVTIDKDREHCVVHSDLFSLSQVKVDVIIRKPSRVANPIQPIRITITTFQ